MNAVLERNADKVSQGIKAIGITNQRETTVAWNKKTGEPLHNAIVWMDKRTAECVKEIENSLTEEEKTTFTKNCGLPINTYFSGSKMWWFLRNVASVKKLASEDPNGDQLCFSTIDTWLIAKLSGLTSVLTDSTNASRTMLMNLSTLEWDSF